MPEEEIPAFPNGHASLLMLNTRIQTRFTRDTGRASDRVRWHGLCWYGAQSCHENDAALHVDDTGAAQFVAVAEKGIELRSLGKHGIEMSDEN